jgi:hypothetical protein
VADAQFLEPLAQDQDYDDHGCSWNARPYGDVAGEE